MIQVTQNIYVENNIPSCNLGLVTTKEGLVIIDTPSRPTNAIKWRDEVIKKGDVRYCKSSGKMGHNWDKS